MERLRNILMVHGAGKRCDAALTQAARLAASHDARLTVATVVPDNPLAPLMFAEATSVAARDRARNALDGLVEAAGRAGVDATSLVLEGRAGSAIAKAVARRRYDLVVLSDKARETFVGLADATAAQVVRHCPCPVWVIKTRRAEPLRRIVAAIGCADPASPLDDLDARVVALAAGLARTQDCRLDVLRPWDFRGADRERSRSELLPAMYARMHEEHRQARAEGVRHLLARLGLADGDCAIHLPHEAPLQAVAGFAQDGEVDVVVTGMRCRQGFDRLFSADPAERLLGGARRSVIIVKPTDAPVPVSLAARRRRRVVPIRQPIGATSGILSRRMR